MVDGLLLAARLVLAGVFLVSGLAKLIDQSGTRRHGVALDCKDRPEIKLPDLYHLQGLDRSPALLITAMQVHDVMDDGGQPGCATAVLLDGCNAARPRHSLVLRRSLS